ncbi:hypothetical protein HPB48_025382 [Haemaphysalis longicornis]|uniref:Uncharacterized protein n=1 Tax=Haemaphysalis longicornis TaxID=44386 RepID=A0A9J6H7H8_HAELO|nr:hypothetical protein HPB48_025382 [Haemaphysalis longicornis]
MKQRVILNRATLFWGTLRRPTISSIGEDFLFFVPVDDVSASSLANRLKRELLNLCLHLNMMRGQGYDAAAARSGTYNGVQALIRDDFSTALHTHSPRNP